MTMGSFFQLDPNILIKGQYLNSCGYTALVLQQKQVNAHFID